MLPSGPGFAVARRRSPPPRSGPGVGRETLRAWKGARTRAWNPGPPNPHVPPRPGGARNLRPRPAPGRSQPAAGLCQPRSAPPGLPTVPSVRPRRRPDSPQPRSPGRSARASASARPSRAGPPRRGPAPTTHCAAAAVVAGPGDAGGRRTRARGRVSPRPAATVAAAEGTTDPAPGVAAPAARRGRRLPSRNAAPRAQTPPNGGVGWWPEGQAARATQSGVAWAPRSDRLRSSPEAPPRRPNRAPEAPPRIRPTSRLRLQIGISPDPGSFR